MALRPEFWDDVREGIAGGAVVGLVAAAVPTLVGLLTWTAPDDMNPVVFVTGSVAFSLVFCCYVGAMVGAFYPLTKRGASGWALVGALTAFPLGCLASFGFALFSDMELSLGRLLFMPTFMAVLGGAMGLAWGVPASGWFPAGKRVRWWTPEFRTLLLALVIGVIWLITVLGR